MATMNGVVCSGFRHVHVDEASACEAAEFVRVAKG